VDGAALAGAKVDPVSISRLDLTPENCLHYVRIQIEVSQFVEIERCHLVFDVSLQIQRSKLLEYT
jgi:hypothetical protein